MLSLCVFVCLVNFVLLTQAQLLIAVPNTSRPSDQIFNPNYIRNNQGGQIHSHSHNGHGQPEAESKVGPNGGLTITIKLQPHVMAALQGKTGGIQADASYIDNAVVKPTRGTYPSSNVYYGNYKPDQQQNYNTKQIQNYNPKQLQHQQQQQPARHQYYNRGSFNSPNSIIQKSQQYNNVYGGQSQGQGQSQSQGQGQSQSQGQSQGQGQNQYQLPYSTLPGPQVPPTPNPYDILSNNNLNHIINDAMKDSENETPMFVNVASTVVKSVKDIPTNLDTMLNDFGSLYRKTLFKLKDTMKSSMPEILHQFGRGGSNYKSQYRDEFLDGYGV